MRFVLSPQAQKSLDESSYGLRSLSVVCEAVEGSFLRSLMESTRPEASPSNQSLLSSASGFSAFDTVPPKRFALSGEIRGPFIVVTQDFKAPVASSLWANVQILLPTYTIRGRNWSPATIIRDTYSLIILVPHRAKWLSSGELHPTPGNRGALTPILTFALRSPLKLRGRDILSRTSSLPRAQVGATRAADET